MTSSPPRRGVLTPRRGILPVILLVLVSGSMSPAALAAEGSYPGPSGNDPTPDLWLISTWLGFGGAENSDALVRFTGIPSGTSSESDFSTMFLVGVRGEFYSNAAGRVARHFGFAIEFNGMFGEFEVETRPGSPSDGVTFVSGVAMPGFVIRFPGKRWEGYLGAGPTVMWWSYVDSVDLAATTDDYDSDFEIPLGLSAFAGLRHTYSREWLFMMETRYQTGENGFELGQPRTEIDIDWRTMQFVIGFTYKY